MTYSYSSSLLHFPYIFSFTNICQLQKWTTRILGTSLKSWSLPRDQVSFGTVKHWHWKPMKESDWCHSFPRDTIKRIEQFVFPSSKSSKHHEHRVQGWEKLHFLSFSRPYCTKTNPLHRWSGSPPIPALFSFFSTDAQKRFSNGMGFLKSWLNPGIYEAPFILRSVTITISKRSIKIGRPFSNNPLFVVRFAEELIILGTLSVTNYCPWVPSNGPG